VIEELLYFDGVNKVNFVGVGLAEISNAPQAPPVMVDGPDKVKTGRMTLRQSSA